MTIAIRSLSLSAILYVLIFKFEGSLGGVLVVCGECYLPSGKLIGLLLFCLLLLFILSILFLKANVGTYIKIQGMSSLA